MIIELNLLEIEYADGSDFFVLMNAMKTLNMGMSDTKAALKEWLVYNRRPDSEIETAMATVEEVWMHEKGGLVDKGPIVSAQVMDYQDLLIRGNTPDEAFTKSGLALALAPAIFTASAGKGEPNEGSCETGEVPPGQAD